MNALIGGPATGAEEMAAFRQTERQHNPHQSTRRTTAEEVDISKMTAAETAKMLTGKTKSSYIRSSRYRSNNKVLTHHQLLAEELSKQKQQKTSEAKKMPLKMQTAGDDADDGDDGGFLTVQTAVVMSKRFNVEGRQRRLRRSNSSSSSSFSSDDEERVRRKSSTRKDSRNRLPRRDSSSSSSSDEGDSNRRNRRVLASRRVKEVETIVPKLRAQVDSTTDIKMVKKNDSTVDNITDHEREMCVRPTKENRKKLNPTKVPIKSRTFHSSSGDEEETVSSSDSSSSSSDTSSSNNSSSSSEDEEFIRLKPIFVPKHKRNLVQTEEKKFEEEELKLQLENERKSKRVAESRALVAKQLASSNLSLQTDEDELQDEESGGAINHPPNDDDELDKEKERNRWEIRELDRLLKSVDMQETRSMVAKEYSRRKTLTDAECLKEDIESGRYQAPGSGRDRNTVSKNREARGIQRFFHRGAYYMDESEWDRGDIRHKAVEYAATATGEDKIDKSKLPEIMQVKNFGRSRQNQKYKGLAKEDTSDKSAHVLPLRKTSQTTKWFEEK